MANNNGQFGISNPNGDTYVDFKTDPVGVANAFTAGVTSGFKVRASDPAGLSVTIGGETGVQDSAIIKSSAGIIYPVGNNTGDPVTVEVPAPSSTNPRIDSVVLSVDTTATTSELNGSDLVSIDIVSGTASSSPVAPSSSDIASEIGSGRAFVVLANITTPASASVITDGDIATADVAKLAASNVDFATYTTTEKIVGTWTNGKPIYRKNITGTYPNTVNTRHTVDLLTGVDEIISTAGNIQSPDAYSMAINSSRFNASGSVLGENTILKSPDNKATLYIYFFSGVTPSTNSPRYNIAVEYTKI